MAKLSFATLTEKERDWINQQLEGASLFVAAMLPGNEEAPVSLQSLDRAFAAWLNASPEDNTEVNGVINAVGIRFGQFLVDDAGFEWTIATDPFGTGLAVRALPGRGDVTVRPANFVAKRWERRESDFLVASFQAIQKQVAEVAADWREGPKHPWWRFWK